MELPLSSQIICTICQDVLGSEESSALIATGCGHLFHKKCLSSWFDKDTPVRRCMAGVSREELLRGSCPVCATPQWLKRCVKIYPNLDDEETNLVATKMRELAEELEETKMKLKAAEVLTQKQKRLIAELSKPTAVKLQRALTKATPIPKTPPNRKSMEMRNVSMKPKSKPIVPKLTMTLRSASVAVTPSTASNVRNVNRTASSIHPRPATSVPPTARRERNTKLMPSTSSAQRTNSRARL